MEYNPDYAPFAPDFHTAIKVHSKDNRLVIETTVNGFRFLTDTQTGKIVGTEIRVKLAD